MRSPDLLDTGAKNLDGQGQKLHDTNRDLSKALETLSGAANDLFGTVKNLQAFTTMLATNDTRCAASTPTSPASPSSSTGSGTTSRQP